MSDQPAFDPPAEDRPAPGAVVDLIPTSRSERFLSWVDGGMGGAELLVTVPADPSSRPVVLPLGEQVEVVWRGDEGLRCLPAVLDAVVDGERPRWHLRPVGPVKRGQRRDAVRAPITVPVRLGPEDAPARGTTVDLSESGLRCVMEKDRGRPAGDRRDDADADAGTDADADAGTDARAPRVGEVLRVAAALPDLTITCLAEVIRLHPREDARVELSLRFIGLQDHQQDLVRRRVFARLRELRQRGLL